MILDPQRFVLRVDALVSVYTRHKCMSNASRLWVADMLDEHPKGDGGEQLMRLQTYINNALALEAIAKRLQA